MQQFCQNYLYFIYKINVDHERVMKRMFSAAAFWFPRKLYLETNKYLKDYEN